MKFMHLTQTTPPRPKTAPLRHFLTRAANGSQYKWRPRIGNMIPAGLIQLIVDQIGDSVQCEFGAAEQP